MKEKKRPTKSARIIIAAMSTILTFSPTLTKAQYCVGYGVGSSPYVQGLVTAPLGLPGHIFPYHPKDDLHTIIYHLEYYHIPYILHPLPTPPVHEKHPGIVRPDKPPNLKERKENYAKKLQEHKTKISKVKKQREKVKAEEGLNERDIIFEYLQSKNINRNNIKTNNLLKIKNKTLSIDFFLKDKNLIIKYLNLEDIKQAIQNPLYKKSFEKYVKDWEKLGEKYIKEGWKIKIMKANNEGEIKRKLEEIVN